MSSKMTYFAQDMVVASGVSGIDSRIGKQERDDVSMASSDSMDQRLCTLFLSGTGAEENWFVWIDVRIGEQIGDDLDLPVSRCLGYGS